MSTAPSSARHLVNAANAQHSTGPRTEEGKARSSRNAVTHGLTAKDLVLDGDDRVEFDALLAGYQADIRPQGALQQSLFHQLVVAAWNLRRIQRMEAALLAQAPDPLEFLNNEELQKKLDRLARHHTRIERTFHRSLRELKALQTNTTIQASLPRQIRESVPPLACAVQIAKRTQAVSQGGDYSMVKRLLESADSEALALESAARAQFRVQELEKQLQQQPATA